MSDIIIDNMEQQILLEKIETEANLNVDLAFKKIWDYKSDVEKEVVDPKMDFKIPEYKSDEKGKRKKTT